MDLFLCNSHFLSANSKELNAHHEKIDFHRKSIEEYIADEILRPQKIILKNWNFLSIYKA